MSYVLLRQLNFVVNRMFQMHTDTVRPKELWELLAEDVNGRVGAPEGDAVELPGIQKRLKCGWVTFHGSGVAKGTLRSAF